MKMELARRLDNALMEHGALQEEIDKLKWDLARANAIASATSAGLDPASLPPMPATQPTQRPVSSGRPQPYKPPAPAPASGGLFGWGKR